MGRQVGEPDDTEVLQEQRSGKWWTSLGGDHQGDMPGAGSRVWGRDAGEGAIPFPSPHRFASLV